MAQLLSPIPPGEILQEEFLVPMGLSANALAKAIGVPRNRISLILKGDRAITADTDLRLSRFFGLSEGYWLRLQVSFDLKVQSRLLADQLKAIKPFQLACS
ncbi:HigA family addiction module antitoxin [Cyanobium sp. ATX 6F1]|uniref:HigA family addiction module antitoxin n=1 Tax=Cyanobium sp. ATX 6F1 TaxID=2823702 RepID=UPI0020CDE077|nr:HigA family addiction module antitoxin [Cyanobium sp. ATX 6F1]MCP9914862.1 HigA family addiction module antidote protein [Cyanobium sp. ATX 6F1]